MKTYFSILLLVLCSFAFVQCDDRIDTDENPAESVKLTVRYSVSPILKDGDDDEDPDPMFDLAGSVADSNGNPVEASVELISTPGNSLVDSTPTDNNGSYIFYDVSAGSYNVVAKVNGSVVDSVSITI